MLILLGVFIGAASGLLGVGGGIILVPILVALDYGPLKSVGTSALAVMLIALSGSYYNYKKYVFDFKSLALMAFPCVFATQLGVMSATYIKPAWLLIFFALLLVCALVLLCINKDPPRFVPAKAKTSHLLYVGTLAGFLAGMFGVGGGVILVPLQVLVLNFEVKTAIRNSLAVVLVAALFSTLGHTLAHNIIFKSGLLIGLGGVLGAQIGSFLLPKLEAQLIKKIFVVLLLILIIYVCWEAFKIS
jgi:uncharacterized membrane protein YfcA